MVCYIQCIPINVLKNIGEVSKKWLNICGMEKWIVAGKN